MSADARSEYDEARLVLKDGRRVPLHNVRVEGDQIVGLLPDTTWGSDPTYTRAQLFVVPIADVDSLVVRRTMVGTYPAVVAGLGIAVALIVASAAAGDLCLNLWGCD